MEELVQSNEEGPLVAKFGGTSMAQPDAVIEHLRIPNSAEVVVASAPGTDDEYPTKMTDMLLGYAEGKVSAQSIHDRLAHILDSRLGGGVPESREVLRSIYRLLPEWRALGQPVEALGEQFMAQVLAAETGRQFVDASKIIFFRSDGTLDEAATNSAIRQVLQPGVQYVIPGFYGVRKDTVKRGQYARVQVFPRGGSDITGAIVANALSARRYDNWSDVAGFMSADPRVVSDARLISELTYREAREFGNAGTELLHRTVLRLLGRTAMPIAMRNTFGLQGNVGTIITATRNWQKQPVVAVSGRDDMLAITMEEFGLNEEVGATAELYDMLRDAGIPYEHSATTTDDVSVIIPSALEHMEALQGIAEAFRRPGRELTIAQIGMVSVIGEGLARSSEIRYRTDASLANEFANEHVVSVGDTNWSSSVTLTQFVAAEDTHRVQQLAHARLGLGEASSEL